MSSEVQHPRKAQLSEYQISAVARMAALGAPIGIIAASVGKQPKTVARWLDPEVGDQRILEERDRYEAKILTVNSLHHFNMMDRYDRAVAAIDEGLSPQGGDIRVRLETAKYVIDEVRPPKGSIPGIGSGSDQSGNLEATNQVAKFLGEATGFLQKLTESVGPNSFHRSLSEVADALPGPAAPPKPISETVEVEIVEPTDEV